MRLGLIVNPIAGMGGSVGLHGTDGETYREAAALGAVPIAHRRAGRAVRLLAKAIPDLRVMTGSGAMGENTAREAGLFPVVVRVSSNPTTSADTREVAARMLEEGIGLIAFAGGDGTARDIVGVVGTEVPVVGIPTGVKMHSAVFGNTPEAAGAMVARYLASPDQVPLTRREVLDAGDDPGHVAGFSVASVPRAGSLLAMQPASQPAS